MNRFSLLLALPLLWTFPAAPLWATEPDDAASETQWTLPESAPPAPGDPSQDTAEGGYAGPDRRRMDEERRKDVLDQICRKIKLRKNFRMGDGDWPKTTLGFNRRMTADMNGSLALIDEETLRVDWGRSLASELGEGGPSGSLWAGASLSGKSMVVRRLGSFSTCGELDRLINVTDIKLALPFTAKRITAMDPGELWRIPLTLNIGYGVGLSDAFSDGTLSISMGVYSKGKSGAASMTLWRLSESKARFRFRIDYVDVRSRSFGIHKTIPALEWVKSGGNFAMELVDKEIAKQLRRYVSAYLNLGSAKSDGKRLVLEYVADPRDPEQAAALADALRGNFSALLKLAKRMATSRTTPDETREAYDDFEEDNSLKLGPPSYAALSEYGARTRTFSLNLPFLVNRVVSESFAHDQVTRHTGEGGQYQFHNAARTPNAEYFNMPFIGPLVKDLEHRNMELVTYAPRGQGHGEPIAVYIHNQGYLRLPASSVRDAVEDANSILRLAGSARRGTPDRGMEIPGVAFLPPVPPADPQNPHGPQEVSDQKGWTSFTMVLNQKAVREALSASGAEVLKAFAAGVSLSDRSMAEWLAANGRLEGGRLIYDEQRAKEELNFREDGNDSSWLAKMSREAAGLVLDLGEASAATNPIERSSKLAEAFSHRNRSGLSHRDILRVLVQFVDPVDLTGDFVSAVEGSSRRGVKIAAHYVLKKNRLEVPFLRAAGETRGRFADGSTLTD